MAKSINIIGTVASIGDTPNGNFKKLVVSVMEATGAKSYTLILTEDILTRIFGGIHVNTNVEAVMSHHNAGDVITKHDGTETECKQEGYYCERMEVCALPVFNIHMAVVAKQYEAFVMAKFNAPTPVAEP